MKTSTTQQIKKITTAILAVVFWVGVWQIISIIVGKELLVPSPTVTVKSLIMLSATADFWISVLLSALRIVAGFVFGIIIGAIGGFLAAKSKLFYAVFAPIVHIARAVPVASFIILALVWIRTDSIPIFITALMVAPIIWQTVYSALNNIDTSLVEMGSVFGLSEKEILLKIKLPQITAPFLASVTTALGLAWKSGIAAEVICQPDLSIGTMLYESKIYLETANTFAVTLVVVIISLILELIVKRLTARWQI